MASVDPNTISGIEVVGIQFQVRELKSSSRKDIAKTLEAVGQQKGIVALIELLSTCCLRYLVGWNRENALTQDSLEDALDVKDMVALLRATLLNGMLGVEDKKKSESQLLSNVESSAIDATGDAALAMENATQSSAQFVEV